MKDPTCCPPLLSIPPDRLVEVIEALCGRGMPIEINVLHSEEDHVKVVFELTEEDEGWLADFLAQPGESTPGGGGH